MSEKREPLNALLKRHAQEWTNVGASTPQTVYDPMRHIHLERARALTDEILKLTEHVFVPAKVTATLTAYHEMLCDEARGKPVVVGVLAAFAAAGIITQEEKRIRTLALEACPGHNGGGRVWCAYCGTVRAHE